MKTVVYNLRIVTIFSNIPTSLEHILLAFHYISSVVERTKRHFQKELRIVSSVSLSKNNRTLSTFYLSMVSHSPKNVQSIDPHGSQGCFKFEKYRTYDRTGNFSETEKRGSILGILRTKVSRMMCEHLIFREIFKIF